MLHVLFSYWVADAITSPASALDTFAKKDAHKHFSQVVSDSIVIPECELSDFKKKWDSHKKRDFQTTDFIS